MTLQSGLFGLPLGPGANGTVMTADSSAPTGVRWDDPVDPLLHPSGSSSVWLPGTTMVSSGGSTNRALYAAGVAACVPFTVTRSITITRVATGFTVAQTSGDTFTMAIYSPSTTWSTASLLASTTLTSDATTGRKTATVSWALAPATYLAAYFVPNAQSLPQGRWPQLSTVATVTGDANSGLVLLTSSSGQTTLPTTISAFTANVANPAYWPWGIDTWQ